MPGFNAAGGWGPFLHPFDPATNQPRDIGLGGPSTEYLGTATDAYGQPYNFPTIWWDDQGNPHLLDQSNALAFMDEYEALTGKYAPRFDSMGAAEWAAKNRSAQGGATDNALAIYGSPWALNLGYGN